VVDLLLGVPYFLMELLLDVLYFHSGQETCSSVCHIFMGDLLLGVPYFMVRMVINVLCLAAELLLSVPYFHSGKETCSSACYILPLPIQALLLPRSYFFQVIRSHVASEVVAHGYWPFLLHR